MKIEGTHSVNAPRARVYQALTDPEVLRRSLPGCERLEQTGENVYAATLRVGLGTIKAVFTGTARMEELQPPERLRLVVEGKGAPGFARGSGALELEEREGATVIRYEGEVQVGGVIAGVGQRMIEGAAKRMASQFFAAIESAAQSNSGTPPKKIA